MRIRKALLVVSFLCELRIVPGQTSAQLVGRPTWSLPQGRKVKDAGPRTYQVVINSSSANPRGDIFQRQRVAGEYIRGLPAGQVMWKDVTLASVDDATSALGPAHKLDFMEGFRYRDNLGSTFAPDFFKGFPATAVMERNLIWDTGMIEIFGQEYFSSLKLNEPYHAISDQSVKIPGIGTFRNRDVTLEWVGYSQKNHELCALIEYQAFFNPLVVAMGDMTMKGRTDYWGQIWVSLRTKQIEYGTLYENVTAELKLPGQSTVQNVVVFRAGTVAPISGK